jgi:hypothetical protein
MTGRGTEEDSSSWKLKSDTKEGLIFIARVDMLWCGVTWNRHYEDKAFSIKFAYRTRGDCSNNDNVGELSEWL